MAATVNAAGAGRLAAVVVLVGLAGALPDRNSLTVFHETNASVRLYQLESIVVDGRLSIEGALCRAGPGKFGALDVAVGADGRPYPNKAPGPVLFALPFYALLTAAAGGVPPLHWAATWLALLTQWLPLLAACALWARRVPLGARPAAFVALVCAATPLFVYGGLFQDYALATALLMVGAALALRGGRPLWAGVALGAAGLCNYQFIVHSALVALVATAAAPGAKARMRRAARIAAGAAPFAIALLAYHAAVFGSPWTTPYAHLASSELRTQAAGAAFRASALADALWGERRGIVWFAPWFPLGLAGLVWAMRRPDRRALAVAGLGVTLATFAFYAVWGGTNPDMAAFNRHLSPSLPFLAAGALWAVEAAPRGVARTAAAALLGGTALVAATVAFACAWTYPYHPLREALPVPGWTVGVELLRHGVHLRPWHPVLGAAMQTGPPTAHWSAVFVSAVALVAALGVALRTPRHPWPAGPAGTRFLAAAGGALLVAVVLAAGQAFRAARPIPPDAGRWLAQAVRDVRDSHRVPPGSGWRADGYPDNPWCHRSEVRQRLSR